MNFSKLGVPVWGALDKDCSILGPLLGSPYLGKLQSKFMDNIYSGLSRLSSPNFYSKYLLWPPTPGNHT